MPTCKKEGFWESNGKVYIDEDNTGSKPLPSGTTEERDGRSEERVSLIVTRWLLEWRNSESQVWIFNCMPQAVSLVSRAQCQTVFSAQDMSREIPSQTDHVSIIIINFQSTAGRKPQHVDSMLLCLLLCCSNWLFPQYLSISSVHIRHGLSLFPLPSIGHVVNIVVHLLSVILLMRPAHFHFLSLIICKISWALLCSLTHLFVFLSVYVIPNILLWFWEIHKPA